jgi:hypothetical protein
MKDAAVLTFVLMCLIGTAWLVGSFVRAVFWASIKRRMTRRRMARDMGWRKGWDRVR